jgi:hypothetical protein
MATRKKSFILYCDLIHTIKQLPDDKAGALFKHILLYVNHENPISEDLIVNLCFEPIKQQLNRDLIKYKGIVERNQLNGIKGGRPKKEEEKVIEEKEVEEKPKETQKKPNKPVGIPIEQKPIYRKFNHLTLTEEEFFKLNEVYTQSQIDSVLDSIENYKKNTNYKSLYLTCVNWLKKDVPAKDTQTHNFSAVDKLNKALGLI